jgi:hypothetical protein
VYVAWTGAADWGESGEANEVLYFDAKALGVPVSYVEGAADEEEKHGHPDANESEGTHDTVTLEFTTGGDDDTTVEEYGESNGGEGCTDGRGKDSSSTPIVKHFSDDDESSSVPSSDLSSATEDEGGDEEGGGAGRPKIGATVYANAPVAAKFTPRPSAYVHASSSSPSSSSPPTSWVEIEELCWILNPTKYWALVHPGKAEPEGLVDWMDSTTAKNGSSMGSFHRHSTFEDTRSFERHHTLAKFYVAQILLYAELCLGRSYNCIGKLETMFPFELVVSCMLNTLLPDEVRAAFAVLMAHLHVSREPQIHHQYPQLVRENMTHRSARIGSAHQAKFIMLVHLVQIHFETYDTRDDADSTTDSSSDILDHGMLRLLSDLMFYGFINSEAQIKQLVGPLVSCLKHSVTDTANCTQSSMVAGSLGKRVERSASFNKARRSVSSRSSNRLSRSHSMMRRYRADGSQHVRQATQTKVLILQIFSQCLDIGLDMTLTTLLCGFQKIYSHKQVGTLLADGRLTPAGRDLFTQSVVSYGHPTYAEALIAASDRKTEGLSRPKVVLKHRLGGVEHEDNDEQNEKVDLDDMVGRGVNLDRVFRDLLM